MNLELLDYINEVDQLSWGKLFEIQASILISIDTLRSGNSK